MSGKSFKYYILIAGYNCQDWIEKCIKSVIKQKFTKWYCVIGDDASTDQTYDLIRKYDTDERFTIFQNSENMGACFTRHKGLSLVSHLIKDTDVIVHLDGDDWFAHNKTLSIVHSYYKTGAEVTYGNWIKATGKKNHKFRIFPQYVLNRGTFRKYPWTSTALRTFQYKLYRRIQIKDLQDSQGFWLKNCTDVAVMFPILEMADPNKIIAIQQEIYVYNNLRKNSTHHRFGEDAKKKLTEWIRNKPRYTRIK